MLQLRKHSFGALAVLLILATLALSGMWILAGRPGAGLLVTLSTVGHFMAIRYLRRPTVKTYFKGSAASSTQ